MVHVDLATWFASGAGRLVDPRTAGAGTDNARIVSRNIKRSFRAFRDDNHDGHDDHADRGERGGDDGNGGHL